MPPKPADAEGGITMWGAPSTGKTTFLAALNIALLRQDGQANGAASWRVVGVDKADSDALTKLTTSLVKYRAFPDATTAIEQYDWELIGTVRRTLRQNIFRQTHVTETVNVPLHLVDAPGEAADPAGVGPVAWEQLIDNLERSRGIVFLFDPIHEFDSGDAFIHTVGVVNDLNRRMRDQGSPGGRLPHHVAVCVAKFDEVRVLETAEQTGMIEHDPEYHGFPRVPEDEAKDFFVRLCEVAKSGDADMVPNLLEKNFRPDRIKYFVTSAIGFYIDPHSGNFDRNDFQNHLPRGAGEPSRIRGPVYPVNVVEPMLWLGKSLTEATR